MSKCRAVKRGRRAELLPLKLALLYVVVMLGVPEVRLLVVNSAARCARVIRNYGVYGLRPTGCEGDQAVTRFVEEPRLQYLGPALWIHRGSGPRC